MKLLMGIMLVLFIGQSKGHGCSTSCCYSPVKFYCCQCDTQQTTHPSTATPPHPTQPSIITVTGGSSVNVVTSNVVNDVKLNNDITLENQINNVNKIHNPISIHQTNINSISNTIRKTVPLSSSPTPLVWTTSSTTTSRTVTTTEKEKCEQQCEPKQECCPTVKPCKTQECPTTPTCVNQECRPTVPTCNTPTCPTAPSCTTNQCQPRQEQCCTVIRPCNYQGCQHTTQTCGRQCIAPIVYIPYNPCPSYGCQRRSYWGHTRCAQNSCHYVRQDCSNCHQTFYRTYATFLRCYGCFSYGGSYGGGYVY